MSAIETFSFSGFTLRPAIPKDRTLAAAWTLADPFHKARVNPNFWLEQAFGKDSYLLSDARGPVFFFKLERLSEEKVECHIQFMPANLPDARERTRAGLIQGFEWIERVLGMNSVRSLVFNGDNPELIRFAKKRLGFTGETSRLVRPIPAIA
jgi:hypothetical protein